MKARMTRRRFVSRSLVPGAPALAMAAPLGAAEPTAAVPPVARLQVVCVGAHPDDPESSCSGTLALYAARGHETTVVYLTRGERGIPGKSDEEAATIRSQEAREACRILGAQPVFAGQIDGSTEFNQAEVERLRRILAPIRPDVVFLHWPIDTHRDHIAASSCALCACRALERRPRLCYFEVNTGSQSQGFAPNLYVDVTSVLERKRDALLAHASQDGAEVWRTHHEPIALWRGRESGVNAAEAFYQLNREAQSRALPGL